ncbi:Os11g0153450 [Oryza sativa Japonica Group]|uniref:Os11g0153450 protein n=1 Tax=Oryza sativa subsp. japonica TaxID=39947 RepID=A0A0P0XZ41_ORYSJ|nr:hypothetical protein EE612_053551 [Oryza sativa]BAT12734.1 Os11g0153450 [Oryza sativa Japonica Group]
MGSSSTKEGRLDSSSRRDSSVRQGLWCPLSSDGSLWGRDVSSRLDSCLPLRVFCISILRKFITCTAYISAVNGSDICITYSYLVQKP